MERKPKPSAHYFGGIARTGTLPDDAQVKPQPDAAQELRHLLEAQG